jgi:probable lipoprotein NlpC
MGTDKEETEGKNNKPFPMKTTCFLLISMILLGGCASYSPPSSPAYVRTCTDAVSLNNPPLVRKKLLEQYLAWKGTRYRPGGLNRNGVDCSGFVHLTYRSQLCLDVPRSTDRLAAMGRNVGKSSLRPGDLIFFKTGLLSRHVGIYVEEGTFLHVSSRKGVTLSRLDDQYWSRRYWKARRL